MSGRNGKRGFGSSRPGSISGGMDRKIESLVRQYLESQKLEDEGDSISVPTSMIIQYIQEEDQSLKRVKRQQLDKSVEKALALIKAENPGEEDAADFESDFEAFNEAVEKDGNSANKRITGGWSTATSRASQSKLSTPAPETPRAPQASIRTESKIVKPTELSETMTSRKRERNPGKEVSSKRQKSDRSPPTGVNLRDIGGIEHILNDIHDLIDMPLNCASCYEHLGIQIPRGILLHGPPGCGKTMLANAIAAHHGVPFIPVSAPSVVSGMSGESEKKLRDIFEEAKKLAPSIIFLDEIDAVMPKRESAQREMEKRIVAQMLTCMDDISLDKTGGKPVFVIGATNRPDSLDPALRRAGRFDREICLSVPDELGREKILKVLSEKLKLAGDFDFKQLAKMTPGFVGADLSALTTAAGTVAIKRIYEELKINHQANSQVSGAGSSNNQPIVIDLDGDQTMEMNGVENVTPEDIIQPFPTLSPADLEHLAITINDFLVALPKVQPSSKREGFATVPDVTWQQIGALEGIRKQLQITIVKPILFPEIFERVGITAPAGVLLWGPPGCGKTLLAKAVANESKANFISVKGPELLNKYVGESERAVRQVFTRARASAPCVIFFDELDALVPRRDDAQTDASTRVVNTLLTELDGLNDRKGVFVIAATNRPDMIDPAMVRPGRLDKPLFVALPTEDERVDILTKLTSKTPLNPEVDLLAIAKDAKCKNFSGADLQSLVREAANSAVEAFFPGNFLEESHGQTDATSLFVSHNDFQKAFSIVRPSVSEAERSKYAALNVKLGWHNI